MEYYTYQNLTLTGHMLRPLARTWFSTPGWLVHKITKQDELNQYLRIFQIDLTVEEVMRIKQFFCNIVFLIFFIDILITGKFVRDIFLDFTLCTLICYLPELYFKRAIALRKKRIQKQLPNFIDALTLAIESGLNFNHAFNYIGSKIHNEIGKQARFTAKEMDFGIPEDTALNHMAERINIEDFTKFTNAVTQAKKLGVSIAKTLRIQSDLIRTRQRQKAEELSRTASVKISIPLVFFIFPALLIIYLGPGLLRLLGQ